jgi:serine/threonine protein kinase
LIKKSHENRSEATLVSLSQTCYGIVQKIGQGGMGKVYLADDRSLEFKVALKFLREAFTRDPERMARFEREAKLPVLLNRFECVFFKHGDCQYCLTIRRFSKK